MIAAATLSNEHVIVSIFACLSLMILSTLTMGQEMFASGSSEEDNDDDDEQEVSDNENFDASDDISSTFLTFEDPKYFYSITYPSTWKVLPDEFGFDEGFNFNSPDGKTIVSVDTEEAFRNELTRLNDDEVKVTLAGIPAYMEKRDDEIQGYRTTKNGIDYRISLVTTEYSAFFPIFQKMVDSLIIETSNLKPGITTFNDTEERLSFQHPVNWTVEPKQNRFDEIEARIQGPPFTVSSSSAVVVNMGDKGDVNGQNLREWFERGLQASSLEFNNMRVVEDVEYSKYAIGGHKAGSVVYSYDQLGERRAGMTVGSVINGTSFIIMFSSSADSFDTDLPTVKEMIDSVHLLKVGSS